MRNAKLFVVLVAVLAATTAYAVPFEPPVITITSEHVEHWESGDAVVTFDLDGRACTVYLVVYTKDQAAGIPYTNTINPANGLAYHYVNGVDTLVYQSTGENFAQGTGKTIIWDGMDKIGEQMPYTPYDYYLIAIDEGSEGDPIPTGMGAISHSQQQANIQYESIAGGIFAKPRAWWNLGYSEFGSDTESPVRVNYLNPEGVSTNGAVTIDPENDAVAYFEAIDATEEMLTCGKCTINPDAAATLFPEYGDEGLFAWDSGYSGYETSGGNMKDGVQVVGGFTWNDTYSTVYTLDAGTGDVINEIDFADWFVDFTVEEGQKCAGPGRLRFSANKPNAVWNTNQGGCAKLCFDPSQEEATIWWANMNGDYYCDKNYPGCEGDDPEKRWICHDYGPGVYNYQLYPDTYDFVHIMNNWAGTGKWQVLGPDGSGIATAITLGNVEGCNRLWMCVLDCNSAYDGVYSQWTYDSGEVDGDGNPIIVGVPAWQGYDICTAVITPGIVGVEDETPVAYDLSNAPDPFNPATTISYSMGKAGNVKLEVFNVLGQKVASLFDGQREAGRYSVRWDASDFANGVYFAVMKTEGFTKTEKMMLVK